MEGNISIGHNHYMRYYGWTPDRDVNPQYADLPDIERAGVIIDHLKPDGSLCSGSAMFDHPVMRRLHPDSNFWTVLSAEPLTLEPSVQCTQCGDHGHITEGKWVPA